MTFSHTIRQAHRWISVLFTLAVVAAFVVPAIRPGADWIYYLPLGPLALLLFSGLYPFARPYLGRRVRKG